MVAHTVRLDFTVSSNVIADVEKRSNLKSTIVNVLSDHFRDIKPLTELTIDGGFIILYSGARASLLTVRGYPQGLITVNVEYYKQDEEVPLLSIESTKNLEIAMQEAVTATRSHTLAPMKRGGPIERYFPTCESDIKLEESVISSQKGSQKVGEQELMRQNQKSPMVWINERWESVKEETEDQAIMSTLTIKVEENTDYGRDVSDVTALVKSEAQVDPEVKPLALTSSAASTQYNLEMSSPCASGNESLGSIDDECVYLNVSNAALPWKYYALDPTQPTKIKLKKG